MYTSGTTGAPKGVVLTNENIVAAAVGLGAGVPIICDTDTYIGYLPLAHILEVAAELTCLVTFLSFLPFLLKVTFAVIIKILVSFLLVAVLLLLATKCRYWFL